MRLTYSQRFPNSVYGPFQKRNRDLGPQELMHKRYEALKNKDLRFVAEDTNRSAIKRYWLMTAKALAVIIEENKKQNKNNCFYEIMPSPVCTYKHSCSACATKLSYYGSRAYLDLEFPTPVDFASFQTANLPYEIIGVAIARSFATFLEKEYNCEAKFLILKSHRAGKYSWHVTFKTTRDGCPLLFRNSLSVLTVMKAFFYKGLAEPYIYYENNDSGEMVEKNVVDDSVYSTHKLYRTYGSQKYGRLTGSFVHDKGSLKGFSDALVLQPITSTTLFFEVEDSESTTKIFKKAASDEGKKRKRSDGGGDEESAPKKQNTVVSGRSHQIMEIYSQLSVWKQTLRFIVQQFPTFERNKVQAKSFKRIYIPLDRDHRCPFKRGSGEGGSHKNNHSCLMLYPERGALYWRCQKRECRDKGTSVYVRLPLDVKMAWQQLFKKKCLVEMTH